MKTKLTNTYIQNLTPQTKYYDVADTELPGLCLRIQPTGVKTFYLRYKLPDGKRRSFRIGNAQTLRVAEAREAARLHWADATRGDDPMARKQKSKGDSLDSYLNCYKDQATCNWHHESVTRIRHSFSTLLALPLSEIPVDAIMLARNRRIKDGKSSGTVNRDIAALQAVFSRAIASGLIEKNPCDQIKGLKEDKGSKPRYLKPDEVKRLYKALDEREEKRRADRDSHNEWLIKRHTPKMLDLRTVSFTDFLKPMVLLALNTGMRRGELFNLEWSDCDLDSASPVLTVRGDGAKSGKTRHIPLNENAKDLLLKWRQQTGSEGLVFTSPKTGGRFDNITKSWKSLMRDAKLENFRFHDTRHHFASMLVQKGVDLNVVRELLGHADLTLTLRYAHLAPKNAAAAVALLDDSKAPSKKMRAS